MIRAYSYSKYVYTAVLVLLYDSTSMYELYETRCMRISIVIRRALSIARARTRKLMFVLVHIVPGTSYRILNKSAACDTYHIV